VLRLRGGRHVRDALSMTRAPRAALDPRTPARSLEVSAGHVLHGVVARS
jgi:hypothetical protein